MMEKGRIFTGKGIATFSIFGRITRAFANLIIFGHRQCIGGDGQDISLHILALGHILHFRDFFQMGVVPVSITILTWPIPKCVQLPIHDLDIDFQVLAYMYCPYIGTLTSERIFPFLYTYKL